MKNIRLSWQERAMSRCEANCELYERALTELVERAEAEGNIDGLPEYDQAKEALEAGRKAKPRLSGK